MWEETNGWYQAANINIYEEIPRNLLQPSKHIRPCSSNHFDETLSPDKVC